MFVRENAVFGQAAGFDISIKKNNINALHGQFARREQPCRASTNNSDQVLIILHVHCLLLGKVINFVKMIIHAFNFPFGQIYAIVNTNSRLIAHTASMYQLNAKLSVKGFFT